MTEVAYAVSGFKREAVNEIVKELLPNYEKDIPNPPKGKRFQECYEEGTVHPNSEYLQLYEEMKKTIGEYSIQIE